VPLYWFMLSFSVSNYRLLDMNMLMFFHIIMLTQAYALGKLIRSMSLLSLVLK
jgi:hypothetical protein